MIRKILSILGGVAAAMIAITLLQMLTLLVHPLPSPEMVNDPDAIRRWVVEMPVSANLLLAFAYAVGSFAGGFVAGRIAGADPFGMTAAVIIGVLLTLSGAVNFFVTMPGSPIWMIVLCLVIYIPFSVLGYRFSRK